jgi:hypothetical protein
VSKKQRLAAGKAADVMDVIKEHPAQDVSHTGYGLQPVEGVGLVRLGGVEEIEVEVLEPLILVGDQGAKSTSIVCCTAASSKRSAEKKELSITLCKDQCTWIAPSSG